MQQDVSYSLDKVVPVSPGLGWSLPPLLHGSEEGVVEENQLVQTGEDPLHYFCIKLHFLPHTSPEHLSHDVQRL